MKFINVESLDLNSVGVSAGLKGENLVEFYENKIKATFDAQLNALGFNRQTKPTLQFRPKPLVDVFYEQMEYNTPPANAAEFLQRYYVHAKASMNKTGVPASVILAQAALESNWGRSGLAVKYKNFFGIKGKGTAGTANLPSGEFENGQDVVRVSGFRVYNTVEESFTDHARLLSTATRYQKAMAVNNDPEAFAKAIHAAGYATDPNYSSKLISLIRKYNLTQYDK